MNIQNCDKRKSNLVLADLSILLDLSEEIKGISQSQREFFNGNSSTTQNESLSTAASAPSAGFYEIILYNIQEIKENLITIKDNIEGCF